MTINLNDVDEFDVGAVTDSDVTANAVDENAANGTVVGVTALASRRRRDQQRDHLHAGRQRRRTVHDRRIDRRRDRGRRHAARSRSGRQPQHHGAGH